MLDLNMCCEWIPNFFLFSFLICRTIARRIRDCFIAFCLPVCVCFCVGDRHKTTPKWQWQTIVNEERKNVLFSFSRLCLIPLFYAPLHFVFYSYSLLECLTCRKILCTKYTMSPSTVQEISSLYKIKLIQWKLFRKNFCFQPVIFYTFVKF